MTDKVRLEFLKINSVKLHKKELKMQMKMWPLEAQNLRGGKTRDFA